MLPLLVKRDCKLFFRDKGTFFSALITPVILLFLYSTFLAKLYRSSFASALPAGFTVDKALIDGCVGGQLLASLLAVSCVTVTFCVNLIMIQDKTTGAIRDLTIAPVKRTTLALAYYISTFISSMIINVVAFAAGLALNAKLTAKDRVVAAFFGDGASNQGIVHETLNLAALWKLPLIAICETNGYAMSTPTSTGVSTGSVAKRAEGYGIPGLSIDGNDFELVRDTVSSLAARARGGEGPSLLECRTYRLSGHSRGDPRVYRTREEEREAWTREPLARLALKIDDKAGLAEAARSVEEEIAASIAFAEADTIRLDDVLEGVYA